MILKGEVMQFEGKTILSVSGNSKIDQSRLKGQKVVAIKSWGKHFLLCFEDFTLRVHFLMFGSYKVNEEKETPIRLRLNFENGFLNLYSCSVKFIEGDVNDHYDWSGDVIVSSPVKRTV